MQLVTAMSPLWTKDTFGNTFLENFHKNLRELISKIIAENMWVFNFSIINCYVWDSETVTWTPIIYVSEPLKNKHEVFFRDEALKSDGCEKKARKKFPQWTIEIEIFLRIIDGLCRRTLP